MQQYNYDDSRYYAHYDEHKNFVCRRVYFVLPETQIPGHACVNENRILPFNGFIDVPGLVKDLDQQPYKPVKVNFEDIWYAMRYETERETESRTHRYQVADTSYPGLLSPVKNPGKKKFRMIDGRRRLWKLMDQGETEGLFYIIPEPDIYRWFWMMLPQKKPPGNS